MTETSNGHDRFQAWCESQCIPGDDAGNILREADVIVEGSRQMDYGNPRSNHGRTAALWEAYLGVRITARDVCWLNILQKASRDRHKPKRDNLVDVAGYARNAELID